MKQFLAASILLAGAITAGAQTVSQSPLSVGGNVPGNLVLTPSVEWPTLDSQANIETTYALTSEYVGYFDPSKCYTYHYDAVETNRYFVPVSVTATRTCNQTNKEWSGNYLNWAATQTIDPFRKALTGGYRTIDTATETVLEKARSDGNTGASIYGDRNISTNAIFSVSTPAPGGPWDNFNTRLRQFGNKMRFTDTGDLGAATPTVYNPAVHTLDGTNPGTVFEVSVRVKVCVSSPALLEENCVQHGTSYKPEGLIQQYSHRMRYSVFGYLNDHDGLRDGAALRARQKYVGPTYTDPATGVVIANTAAEWSAADGTLIRNPDSTDASNTTSAVGATNPILDSGVINYINKFGQMTIKNHKSFDPVSEMYYAAIRYLRNLPNVAEYTNLTVGAATAAERFQLADGFPVITDWSDPYLYHCQNSAILGIGDVNTWNDKNLNGNGVGGTEPAVPGAVTADTINVTTWTQRVATIEGIAIPTVFSGRNNSAYMVGLAYWAHTQDIRPEVSMPNSPRKQTVATYWVDVREAQVLQPRTANQYWLAAKYGGFLVPDTGFDSTTRTTALDTDWWYTNGEDLDPGAAVYPRADNFYVASQADAMVDSLTRAFARIVATNIGSGSSLAANSTRIDIDTRTFQAQFRSGTYGQLNSFTVQTDGSLSTDPVWSTGAPAGTSADPGITLERANWATRNIWMNAGGTHLPFEEGNLTSTQRSQLRFVGMPTTLPRLPSATDFVQYLRGRDFKEADQPNGSLRPRSAPATGWSPILGDIVNSTPVFVGRPSDTLYSGATFNGASSYGAFAVAQATRLGVVWVGANDGMLHAFDASTGREVYAFMPNASFVRGIGEFANPEYDHRYFVDGDMAIADAWNGTAWKTVLVGTMGRGGPGMFALDVTNPLTPAFLWEKSATDIASLGKNIGRPVIAQTSNGVWKVLLGNGVDSGDGSARLIAVNLFTGAVTVSDATTGGTPNGLSAVLARDTDNDGFADTAYAGDLRGNLWKFVGINGTATATTLFTATDGTTAQPITAAPLVGRDPSTSIVWVFFGTGKYLNTGDLASTQVQTWYGIKDNGGTTTRATLVPRTVTGTGTIAGLTVRTVSTGAAADLASMQGWYMDLPVSKERIVVPNRFQGGALIGTSRIPDSNDVCLPTGTGFVMALNPFTGGRLDQTFFDANRDGVFNDSDTLGGTLVSGIGFGSSPNNPIFVENVMQVGLDDGSTRTIRTQGTNVDASRMSWREILN